MPAAPRYITVLHLMMLFIMFHQTHEEGFGEEDGLGGLEGAMPPRPVQKLRSAEVPKAAASSLAATEAGGPQGAGPQ